MIRYELDNDDTIVIRLASMLNTLPKYLILDKDNLDNSIDLLSIIKKHTTEDDISNLEEELKQYDISNLNFKDDVVIPWLIYNTSSLVIGSEQTSILLYGFSNNLIEKGYFEDEDSFNTFWNKRGRELKLFELKILKNKAISDNLTQIYEKIHKTKSTWVFTPFDLEKTSIELTLNSKTVSIMELFNTLVTNPLTPLGYINKYYKIYKNYTDRKSYQLESTNPDVLRLQVTMSKTQKDNSEYSPVYFVKNEDDNNIHSMFNVFISKEHLNVNDSIARVMSNFVPPLPVLNVAESDMSGIFYIAKHRIDSYVFSDLVMNDPLFAYFIKIDESIKTTKKKVDDNQPWLYMRLNHPTIGNVVLSITQHVTKNSDTVVKKYTIKEFPIGRNYISVKIKNISKVEDINEIMLLFSKLLTIYDEKYDTIVREYKKYIPNFATYPIEIEQEIDLSNPEIVAPEVFINTYSRFCKSDRRPTIATDDKLEEYEENDHQIMVFPRDKQEDAEGVMHYTTDGVKQHKYVCLNPKYKFPGLQVNEEGLKNSEYPYRPCCFSVDMRSSVNYQNYYHNRTIKKTNKQQEFIKTDKILNYKIFGNLPVTVNKLLSFINADITYKFIRLGVDRNPSSFISCLIYAMQNVELDESDRLKQITNLRQIFASPENVALCRQSTYNIDSETIRKDILNMSSYFNPMLYCNILEKYFKCNIFVFNKNGLMIPNYHQGYLKYHNSNSRCVLIYEHYGSESDHAIIPQCELIIKWDTRVSKGITYIFKDDERINRNVTNLFNLLRNTYNEQGLVNDTIFSPNVKMYEQHIDVYGKCTMINTKSMTIMTTPIPPLNIPYNSKFKIQKCDITLAYQFLSKNSTQQNSITQSLHNGMIYEISGIIGTVLVKIPVIPISPTSNDVNKSVPINIKDNTDIIYDESYLSMFNKNKKVCRYIIEYMYWLFSKYVSSNPDYETITNEVLNNFSETQMIIDESIDYNTIHVIKTFSLESPLLKDNKLIVQSKEMLKRLMYVLKLYSLQNLKSLINYKDFEVIQDYYLDLTDFDYNPNQVILVGDNSLDKWIDQNTKLYKLYDNVSIDKKPYFFLNKLISNKIYLAQNTSSINIAMDIYKTWVNKGYNPAFAVKGEELSDNDSFILYSYQNPKTITVHEYGDTISEESPKIIGFKINDIPCFTILLELT